jgi:hypothetical protein
MRPALHNIEIRSDRRFHERFGFGPEDDAEDLTGVDFAGSVAVIGETSVDLEPFLSVFTDADGNDWADLDLSAVEVAAITGNGRWELVIDTETRIEGAIVYVESLS